MNRKEVINGLILGIAAPILVALLFIAGFAIYMHIGFDEGFRQLRWKGQIPNVLRIGAFSESGALHARGAPP